MDTLTLGPFAGINRLISPDRIGPGEAQQAENVVTRTGAIALRPSLLTRLAADGSFTPRVLFPFAVAGTPYLYAAYTNAAGTRRDKVLAADFSVLASFSFGAAPLVIPVAVPWGLLLIASSSTHSRKIYQQSGTWLADTLGMSAPGAPSFASIAGNLAYTDIWVQVLWYNADTDTESVPPSETLYSPGVGPWGARITRPASPPSQATHWRIYIRRIGLDTVAYRIATVAIATTTWDLTLSSQLDSVSRTAAEEVPLAGLSAPPGSTAAAIHNGRAWYASTAYPGRVLCSQIGAYEQVDVADAWDCGEQDASQPNVMFSRDGSLWVVKDDAVFAIDGSARRNYRAIRVQSGKCGAVSPYAVADDGERVMWAGPDGVYAFQQGRATPIGQPIEAALFADTQVEARRTWTAAVDHLDRQFILCVTTAAGDGAQQLVMDLDRQIWTRWTAPLSCVGSRISDLRDFRRWAGGVSASGGANAGVLATPASALDFSATPIAWSWETGQLFLGSPRPKRVLYVHVRVAARGASSVGSITLEMDVDDSGTWTTVGTESLGDLPARIPYPVGTAGTTFRFRIRGSSGVGVRILDVTIVFEGIGR